nr:MAG TPA: zinc finger protein [Caudoviricetes sp.]
MLMCKCGGTPQDFEIFERGRDKPCVVVCCPVCNQRTPACENPANAWLLWERMTRYST